MAAIRDLAAGHYSEEQIRAWRGNESPNSYEPLNVDKLVLVEESEEGVCGFAQLDIQAGIVERVYVSPLYARRGIGTRLLMELETVARKLGVAKLCVDASLNAVPFYQSAGYVVVKVREHELQPDIVAMVKEFRE
jgi:putative acetyltransferase